MPRPTRRPGHGPGHGPGPSGPHGGANGGRPLPSDDGGRGHNHSHGHGAGMGSDASSAGGYSADGSSFDGSPHGGGPHGGDPGHPGQRRRATPHPDHGDESDDSFGASDDGPDGYSASASDGDDGGLGPDLAGGYGGLRGRWVLADDVRAAFGPNGPSPQVLLQMRQMYRQVVTEMRAERYLRTGQFRYRSSDFPAAQRSVLEAGGYGPPGGY
ncbi:MAG: hypothetical protein M1826_000749 [Phylliscum demangeonii]|nr:MAG: hypothetical protein M1826_000749 [Phylliscum demangeonii]